MFEIIFNKDTVDAWIGVFGTFIGTLFAGVISAVIALWTYKKLVSQQTKLESVNKAKTIKTIVEFVEMAIASLIFIAVGTVDLKHEQLLLELNKLKNVNKEIGNLNAEFIPENIYTSYLNIKVLLNILEMEIDNIINYEYSAEEYAEKIGKVEIGRRLLRILEHLLPFTDEKHLHSLYNDLKQNHNLV